MRLEIKEVDIDLNGDQMLALREFMLATMEFCQHHNVNIVKIFEAFKKVDGVITGLHDKLQKQIKMYDSLFKDVERRINALENVSAANPLHTKKLN